jgi:hypothetical protein
MELINVNFNNFDNINTHRSGWHFIIKQLLSKINKKILLVDYMDCYFGRQYDTIKYINVENNSYMFFLKDAYYHIKDKFKSDVFIYVNDYGLKTFIKWYPEYNEFKIMRGELMSKFVKKYNIRILNQPWIGILHYPEFPKEMNYNSLEELVQIVKSPHFKKSIEFCVGIISLSDHLKTYIQKIFSELKYDIPIKTILHPTDFNCVKFDINEFKLNKTKSIIQLGFWLRDMKTIYQIKTTKYKKIWLPGGKYWKEMFQLIYPNYQKYLDDPSVIIPGFLTNSEYDHILSKNICLLNVFNSSANNTVLECIVRNTPLLVNRNPAIIEYLGIDYPLYFSDINDLNKLINSKKFIHLLIKTVNYLKNLDKRKFHIDYFIAEVDDFITEVDDFITEVDDFNSRS